MKAARTLLLALIGLTATSATAPAAPPARINICHLNEIVEIGHLGIVISIPLQAWPAHQAHFDYETFGLNVGDLCGIIE
jgi:hypothetical protein